MDVYQSWRAHAMLVKSQHFTTLVGSVILACQRRVGASRDQWTFYNFGVPKLYLTTQKQRKYFYIKKNFLFFFIFEIFEFFFTNKIISAIKFLKFKFYKKKKILREMEIKLISF